MKNVYRSTTVRISWSLLVRRTKALEEVSVTRRFIKLQATNESHWSTNTSQTILDTRDEESFLANKPLPSVSWKDSHGLTNGISRPEWIDAQSARTPLKTRSTASKTASIIAQTTDRCTQSLSTAISSNCSRFPSTFQIRVHEVARVDSSLTRSKYGNDQTVGLDETGLPIPVGRLRLRLSSLRCVYTAPLVRSCTSAGWQCAASVTTRIFEHRKRYVEVRYGWVCRTALSFLFSLSSSV